MCGIVGAVGAGNNVPVLIEGLRRLEYRGYDSCGVAVVRREEDGRISLLWHAVVPREELCATLHKAQVEHPYHMVVVGNEMLKNMG